MTLDFSRKCKITKNKDVPNSFINKQLKFLTYSMAGSLCLCPMMKCMDFSNDPKDHALGPPQLVLSIMLCMSLTL